VVSRAALFPPRQDRRRQSLARIHRQVVEALREKAVLEWINSKRFRQLLN
jgi:hypothetical protein